MEKRDLQPGDIVQIDPAHDPAFGGCLMIVTDPKSWGAQGCVRIPDRPNAKDAYYRCAFEHMEFVGLSVWSPRGSEEEP